MGYDFSNLKTKTKNTGAEAKVEAKKVEKVEVEKVEKVEKVVVESKKAHVESVKETLKNIQDSVVVTRDSVTVVKALNEIVNELNEHVFLERDKEVTMLILALLSESNAFMQGPPGTGKSLLVEEVSSRITDGNNFRILLSKTTDPEDVFGQTSLIELQKDVKKYITKGKLPTSHICFVDEVFKASSAVLNSLLTIMNEKIFFNDVIEKCPLITMIGASNEYPQESSLEALYDRFLLRWPVEYIKDNNNKLTMYNNYINSRSSRVAAAATVTTVTVEELQNCILEVRDVTFTKKILTSYNKLINKLSSSIGITISDRRKNESLKLLQANAFLSGRKTVTLKDFSSLIYSFWTDEDDIKEISDIIYEISNPEVTVYNTNLVAIKEYDEKFERVIEGLNFDDTNAMIKAASSVFEINNAIKVIELKITKGLSGEGNEKMLSDITTKLKELSAKIDGFMSNIEN